MNARIIGTGRSLPERVVTNDDLSKVLDTSDEWISSRTGIRQRHVAEKETSATMASKAAAQAIMDAGIKSEDVQVIIVATSSPDYAFPSTAALVQKNIGAANAMCFDISVACTGFIYGLSIADAYIKSGIYKNALVIGAEVMSREVDWTDRSVCVLFGDGAGAAVLTADEEGFTHSVLHSNGVKSDVLTSGGIDAIDNIYMDGQEVFRFAVKKVPESIREVLEVTGMDMDNIKYYVLHQANIRIIESVAKRLGQDMDKFPVNLQDYGNTSAASIPILLDEMNRDNKLHKGDLILLSGFGAGLSWGSTILKW